MKINIIYNIFIEKGILHTYGRDGKFTKVFLRQGNLEGRCAVYSLMMLLMFHGILNRDDLLHRVSTKAPEYVKKLKRQFRYSTTRGYSFRELRSKLMLSFNNKLPVAVGVLKNRDRDNLKKFHDVIIEQLDKSYPLLIGLWDPQRKEGHSVVVIGYSQFDLATLRLYCLDSACPLPYASLWNNVIDVNTYYDDVDILDYNHMVNKKVLVDSILFINDRDWLDYLIYFPEELDSILPFEPEEQDSILPF